MQRRHAVTHGGREDEGHVERAARIEEIRVLRHAVGVDDDFAPVDFDVVEGVYRLLVGVDHGAVKLLHQPRREGEDPGREDVHRDLKTL